MSLLTPAAEWLELWGNAIVDSLYARDRDLALRWLSDARDALNSDDTLTEDIRSTCGLKLHYFEYQVHKALGDREQWGSAFGEALRAVGTPVNGEGALLMQRILLCLLRSSGMRAGIRDFSPEEFREMFDEIPEDERSSELWHTVANLAYHRRDVDSLGQAFEFFTISADGWLSDYTWQHVNCMYLLVSGRASDRDVLELINRITLTPQMENFNKHSWPLVIERGLVTPELEHLRQDMTDRIIRKGAYMPRKELATKGTVRQM
ncbi:MAG: hypothetical protein M3R04_08150 [bacterium]|nr:hypothetical protein [bacterium]